MKAKRLVNTPDDVRTVLTFMDSRNIAASWSGLCVWIEQAADLELTGILNRLGFEWSAKRGKWYLRAADDVKCPKMRNECAQHLAEKEAAA